MPDARNQSEPADGTGRSSLQRVRSALSRFAAIGIFMGSGNRVPEPDLTIAQRTSKVKMPLGTFEIDVSPAHGKDIGFAASGEKAEQNVIANIIARLLGNRGEEAGQFVRAQEAFAGFDLEFWNAGSGILLVEQFPFDGLVEHGAEDLVCMVWAYNPVPWVICPTNFGYKRRE